MLDSIFDNFRITLLFRCCCEALDASYCVVNEVINKVLIDDLLFVDELSGKSDDDLWVIYEARLHDLWQLGDQRLFFK